MKRRRTEENIQAVTVDVIGKKEVRGVQYIQGKDHVKGALLDNIVQQLRFQMNL